MQMVKDIVLFVLLLSILIFIALMINQILKML